MFVSFIPQSRYCFVISRLQPARARPRIGRCGRQLAAGARAADDGHDTPAPRSPHAHRLAVGGFALGRCPSSVAERSGTLPRRFGRGRRASDPAGGKAVRGRQSRPGHGPLVRAPGGRSRGGRCTTPDLRVRLVLFEAGVAVAIGLGLGLVGALAATRFLAGYLYGVTSLDPLSFGLAIGVAVAMAAMAAIVPSWRALRIDPVKAIRALE